MLHMVAYSAASSDSRQGVWLFHVLNQHTCSKQHLVCYCLLGAVSADPPTTETEAPCSPPQDNMSVSLCMWRNTLFIFHDRITFTHVCLGGSLPSKTFLPLKRCAVHLMLYATCEEPHCHHLSESKMETVSCNRFWVSTLDCTMHTAIDHTITVHWNGGVPPVILIACNV